MVMNVTNNSTQAYIIGGLLPRTAYTVSILAYTAAGDGPRSLHLTVVTRTRKTFNNNSIKFHNGII